MAFVNHAAVSGRRVCGSSVGGFSSGSKCLRRSGGVTPTTPTPTRCRRLQMVVADTETKKTQLEKFLQDAEDLGTIRFINISAGAVLETIGRFDYGKNVFTIPGKGAYLTIANIDKTFECHISLSKVTNATMSTEKAKIGGHDMHVIRLKNEEGTPVLSCLLMYDPAQGPGHFLHGAVDAFEALRAKYGDAFRL